MNILIFTLVLSIGKQGKMKKKLLSGILLTTILLISNICFAETTNVYVINNISQMPYSHGSNIMCTNNGSICTNGYFMLSTRGTRYVKPQWKRQTLREKRLQEESVRAAAKIGY